MLLPKKVKFRKWQTGRMNKKAMAMDLIAVLVIGLIGLFLLLAWQTGLLEKIVNWFESLFSGIGPG